MYRKYDLNASQSFVSGGLDHFTIPLQCRKKIEEKIKLLTATVYRSNHNIMIPKRIVISPTAIIESLNNLFVLGF